MYFNLSASFARGLRRRLPFEVRHHASPSMHNNMGSSGRKPRSSRNKDIPHDLLQNWQSSRPKPLARRPVTACVSCRTAKVKCNGPQCGRCTDRGIVCSYTSTGTLDLNLVRKPSAATDAVLLQDILQHVPEEMRLESNAPATSRLAVDIPLYNDPFQDMAPWMSEDGQRGFADFVWPPTNTLLNVKYSPVAFSIYLQTLTCETKRAKP